MPKYMARGYQGPSTSRTAPTSSKTEDVHSIGAVDTLVAATSGSKPKRTFDPLFMTYKQALDRLVKEGFITLPPPTPEPPVDKRSPRWDGSAYCHFHQGKGHSTEECFKLKHIIQDMIDSEKLPKPRHPKPSNKSNPLGNQAIFVGSIPIIDCSGLIASSEPQVNGIWFSDDEDDWPPNAQVNKISYSSMPHKYGKKKNKKNKGKGKPRNEVSYLTRSRANQRDPLAQDEPSEVIPKKDKGKAMVNETITPIPPPQTTSASPSISSTDPSAPSKGIEDVLQKQLLKTKADISVWQLLRDSDEHREAFFAALRNVVTNPDVSPNQVVNHISTYWLPKAVTFSDSDLPVFGSDHNLALYVNVECRKKNLPVTLIDNRSAVNVLPLSTAYLLGLKDEDFTPCNEGVRAFDGTRRNIKGTISLRIKTGPVERKTDFQVIDVAPSYNMLLGRPWIHAVQAITSTLHQKVKIPLNGEVITLKATNIWAVLDQQGSTDNNATEIVTEPVENLVGFDLEVNMISPDTMPLFEWVTLFDAQRLWPTQGLGYEPNAEDSIDMAHNERHRKRTRDITLKPYTYRFMDYFVKEDTITLLRLFREQAERDYFKDCFTNDNDEVPLQRNLPINNAKLMSMIMRDHKFDPNLLVTDIDEGATQGKRKVFKWTDSQGRTFKLTAQESHTFEASNSDTDREEEEEEEIVFGSSIIGSESGDGSTVVPQPLVSPSVVESLKAGLESLVLDCNLDSEQLALLSSSFEINDKNSSAYFLSRFLSGISFHDAYEKHESKTLNEYIANVISKTEHDPIVEATATINMVPPKTQRSFS
ncbi:hypothetical protein RND81_10G096600 [Saponaria officinalis]|uniref:Uncharacterized protein n=1 Tax=Saponaria officinalis TaxID=3572 RepID=A0AAW1I0D9_SAPOF